MVYTDPKNVPAVAHSLWLYVEIAIDGLAANFDLRPISARQLGLDIFWQLKDGLPLRPGMVSALASFRRGVGASRGCPQLAGSERVPAINGNLHAADATAGAT